VFGQRLKLLNSVEDVDQLQNSSAEQVKLPENLSLREIKSLAFRHIDDFLFGLFVTILVLLVQFDAGAQNINQLCGIAAPNIVAFLAVQDPLLAVGDHLIGDLHEQTRHFIRGVEEPGDRVDHLDRVHQRGQSVDDLLRSTIVQRLHELLQSRQIFHVVFGLVQLVGQKQVQSIVIHDQFGNLFSITSLIHVVLLLSEQQVLHGLEVLVLQLLAPVGDFLHPNPPVVQLHFRTRVRRLLLGFRVVVQQVRNDLQPQTELPLEVVKFLHVLTLLVESDVVLRV